VATACAVAVAVAAASALAGCAAGSPSASSHHGDGLVGYPSYLPKKTLHYRTDATVVGTTSSPALTSQGDTVRALGPSWSALAVVAGPATSSSSAVPTAPVTMCTWTVTLSSSDGDVPVDASAFSAVDMMGHRHQLSLVSVQPPLAHLVARGQRLTFRVRAPMPAGDGMIVWSPSAGKAVAMWDFVVETD
jgi:hypothetical protein